MRPIPSPTLLLTTSLLALSACAEESLWPVRATIDDGQVLMGSIQTPELVLEGGLGTLVIPWEDVGEVEPVEGNELAGSGGFVDVWLRNGSELTGRWVDAALTMDLNVGGEQVGVDVPVSQLLRLQTQGGEIWPQGVVYSVRTSHGDDFMVDPEASRLVLDNEMGTFSPFLSECLSAAPLDEATGDWRIELVSGTVLIGPLVDDAITFQLDLGPDQITVPLDALVSLQRQDWGGYDNYYREDTTRISDRILSALPGPAKRSLQPPMAAPAEAWDPMEADYAQRSLGYVDELGAMAGERIPDGSEGLEVDGRLVDTGGQGGMALRGGAIVGDESGAWFSNRRLREVKQAMQ